MQVQTIFCNQIQYCVFRTSVRARILKFLSKPSPTPIYYPQVFASALSRNSPGTAIAIPRDSRAHPLARWFAGRSPTCHTRPCRACIPLSCNSSCTPIAFLRASRAHPLARWFAGRSPTGNRPATHSRQSPVSDWLVPIKARPHTFVKFTWHGNRPSTGLQGTSARAMICRKITDRQPTGNTQPSEPG